MPVAEPRKPTILIVDDDREFAETVGDYLPPDLTAVLIATSAVEARSALMSAFVDVIVTDERLGSQSGTRLLEACRQAHPGLAGILMSGYADLPMAVRAMQAGAVDLLTKPFDRQSFVDSVRRTLSVTELIREARFNTWDTSKAGPLPGLIGDSAAIRSVASLVRRVAPSEATVLLQGESGTGKELIAQAIHQLSARASGPFVNVNIAAVPQTLLESTLFGVRKGAFTDSKEDRPGIFEAADSGTIFLDEIGETSPELQVRLLKVIEDRVVTRVGDVKPRAVDVRIIGATNRDLSLAVAAKKFREDLYYRLAVFTIHLPPLRERGRDLDLLVSYLVQKYAQLVGRPVTGLSSEALDKLRRHPWYGNVRELDRVIQRAVILTDTPIIEAVSLDLSLRRHAGLDSVLELPFRDAEAAFERAYFGRLLESTEGNKSKAADLAGIHRSVLLEHLKKLGL